MDGPDCFFRGHKRSAIKTIIYLQIFNYTRLLCNLKNHFSPSTIERRRASSMQTRDARTSLLIRNVLTLCGARESIYLTSKFQTSKVSSQLARNFFLTALIAYGNGIQMIKEIVWECALYYRIAIYFTRNDRPEHWRPSNWTYKERTPHRVIVSYDLLISLSVSRHPASVAAQ